jgi:molybdate transport system substrate-binding protein
MRRAILIILILLLGATAMLPASAAAAGRPLTIAAAANLRDVMQALVADFLKTQPDAKVDVVLGSSGKFAEQIAQGAPYDLFFSADLEYPQRLVTGQLASSTVRTYARGQLVLWSATRTGHDLTLADLASPTVRRVAIANPKLAPYGARAQQALEHAGIWDKVRTKLVYGENVSQTAQFADSGGVDVAIIPLSLALSPVLKQHGVYTIIPASQYAPLDQGFVILKRAAGDPLAASFAHYVVDIPARAIFASHGYLTPARAP